MLLWRKRSIERLSKELNAPVIDVWKILGLVAVKTQSMEAKWGLPLVRTNSADWYDLKWVKRISKREMQNNGKNQCVR